MPEPEKGEQERSFLQRCIPQMIRDKDFEQKRAVAACYSIYRRHGTETRSPKPEKKSTEYEDSHGHKQKKNYDFTKKQKLHLILMDY